MKLIHKLLLIDNYLCTKESAYTVMEMSSFWLNFCHWLHWKLSHFIKMTAFPFQCSISSCIWKCSVCFQITSCLQPPWLSRRGIDQQSCDHCACQEPLWTVEVIVQVHRAQGYFRDHTATNDPKPVLARQQDRGGSRMMPSVVEKPALKQQFFKEASWDWTNSYIIGPLWGESTNHWWIHITKS